MAYGFEAYRSDGSTMISSTNGVARLIFSGDYAQNFSGTIVVPAFNSQQGYFSYRMYPFLNVSSTSADPSPLPDSQDFNYKGTLRMGITPNFGPTLSWDNTTKVLTVSPNTDTEESNPALLRHRYRISMVHYK